MARLSSDQWRDIRNEWEIDPRQGIAWLVAANGGKWNVTEEAVRQRRKAELWQKRGTLGSVVEKAQLQADRQANLGGKFGSSEFGPSNGDPEDDFDAELGGQSAAADAADAAASGQTEQSAVDLRAALIERHREEWKLPRVAIYQAAKLMKMMPAEARAKFAKLAAETLAIIQQGERRAWGLDAVQLDLSKLSDDELERVASGRMPT